MNAVNSRMSETNIPKLKTAVDRTMKGSVFYLGVVLVLALLSSSAQAQRKKDAAFLNNYCLKCHNAEKHKGDVRLDKLTLRITGANHELWEEVIHKIQRGEMPPEDAQQPTADERRTFLSEATRLLTRYEEGTSVVRDPLMRLTNEQIAHSIQDLLHTHGAYCGPTYRRPNRQTRFFPSVRTQSFRFLS